MMKIEDLLNWQPDFLSEDHTSNFLVQIFKKDPKKWHLVYYNPPHGSWKSISFIKGEFEYRQVAPKRGVKHVKRPDVALQYLPHSNNDMLTLLLIECKRNRNSWDSDLIRLMKMYFEGDPNFKKSTGIKHIPFWHKRKKGTLKWIQLSESEEQKWLEQCTINYLFGFAYLLGFIDETGEFSSEDTWMQKTINPLNITIPIFSIAVGWSKRNFQPIIIRKYSSAFSSQVKMDIEHLFSAYSLKQKIKLPSLDEFI